MTADDYATIVQKRLNDAGRTLMMLPMPKNSMPGDAGGCWPDILQSLWDVASVGDDGAAGTPRGTVEERLAALAKEHNPSKLGASTAAVSRLDEVLGWLLTIEGRPHWRKAVMGRMLNHPVSHRPVYSWKQIAETLGTNSRTVRHWHASGIQAILEGLARGGR